MVGLMNIGDKRDRRRDDLWDMLALLFRELAEYARPLRERELVPASMLNITPLPGPLPPTVDGVLAHVARCGIKPIMVAPALQSWATHWMDTSAPGPGEAAQPAPPAETMAHPHSAHPIHGAATPGDTTTAMGPPHASATPRQPHEEYDPMAGAAPPPATGSGSSL